MTIESINNTAHEGVVQGKQGSNSQMKLSEFEASRGAGCKDHPNDKQLPGVCSSCLRDKLSQLYNNNPTTDPLCCSPSPTSPASPQPFSSDADGSSNRVLPGNRRRFRRNASHAADSVSCMLSFNYGLNLKKSRSLAFASRSRFKERDASGGWARKKDGFWTKVLKLTRKDTKEAFTNSRTEREGRT